MMYNIKWVLIIYHVVGKENRGRCTSVNCGQFKFSLHMNEKKQKGESDVPLSKSKWTTTLRKHIQKVKRWTTTSIAYVWQSEQESFMKDFKKKKRNFNYLVERKFRINVVNLWDQLFRLTHSRTYTWITTYFINWLKSSDTFHVQLRNCKSWNFKFDCGTFYSRYSGISPWRIH